MSNLFSSEVFVEFSTILILILTIPLASLMSYKYVKKNGTSKLYWSIGLWLFALGVLIEVIFSFNFYSQLLIKLYLAFVALLVGFLGLGSAELLKSKNFSRYYEIFLIASGIFLVYSLFASKVGDILTNYVVFGALPLIVVVASSIMTFPAAAIIVIIAILSYRRTANKKMLSIIAGVVIVSIAGSLYITGFPAFLYYSEFIGILLLWIGFI